MVAQLTRPFECGFGGGNFVLMKEAASEDSLDRGILGRDLKGREGSLLGFGVASGKIQRPGLEDTGLRIVFVPPKSLTGGYDGLFASLPGRPEFDLIFVLGQRRKNKDQPEQGHPSVDSDHEKIQSKEGCEAGTFRPRTS